MNEPDLASLRRAFAAIPPVAPAPESCPSAAALLEAVGGELPPAALREVIEHLATCPSCAEDWRLAVALEHPLEDPVVAVDREAGRWRARYGRLATWCTSAAAAAAIAISGYLWQATPPVVDALRGGGETVQLLIDDGAFLRHEACVLRWSKTRGATYDLDVRVEGGRRVERVLGLAEPRYQVPTAKLAGIPLGSRLDWRVTAHLSDGHSIGSKPRLFFLD